MGDMKRVDMVRLMQNLKKVMSLTYFDSISDKVETQYSYCKGILPPPRKLWKAGKEYYQGPTLEFKEKGATIA